MNSISIRYQCGQPIYVHVDVTTARGGGVLVGLGGGGISGLEIEGAKGPSRALNRASGSGGARLV